MCLVYKKTNYLKAMLSVDNVSNTRYYFYNVLWHITGNKMKRNVCYYRDLLNIICIHLRHIDHQYSIALDCIFQKYCSSKCNLYRLIYYPNGMASCDNGKNYNFLV